MYLVSVEDDELKKAPQFILRAKGCPELGVSVQGPFSVDQRYLSTNSKVSVLYASASIIFTRIGRDPKERCAYTRM